MTQQTVVAWDGGLTDEQKDAAGGVGNSRRLLSGPGTGKTRVLARRILYLVQVAEVQPEDILALTFTRAATFELKKRVRAELGEGTGLPRIQTLHSFALRQLVKNWNKLGDFGPPLRVADDWEMRNIIAEDIKALTKSDVRTTEKRFQKLSADWETLNAEGDGWEAGFPEPEFLGAWREHRRIFGYVLPAELVYTLKRVLDELGTSFELERPTDHMLLDEYQDFNRCDLAVVRALAALGAKPYVAGDDDQSIYGFRFAYPLGIRRFTREFAPVDDKQLTICKRCDPEILDLALFVARQDYQREDKAVKAEAPAGVAQLAILRFDDQYSEAAGTARLCKLLIERDGVAPHEILILLRSDRNGIFSRELQAALARDGIPCSAATGGTPFDEPAGRRLLALLRLAANPDDPLALRTLLQLTDGTGETTLQRVYGFAKNNDLGFTEAVRRIVLDAGSISGGKRVAKSATLHWSKAAELAAQVSDLEHAPSVERLTQLLLAASTELTPAGAELDRLSAYVTEATQVAEAGTLIDFLRSLTTLADDAERHVELGKVNILTMHKAKGLTSEAVIVAGCDDELLPGRNENEPELGDERRLLYVSLTRAKHYLFVSYCTRRLGAQSHSGRRSGGGVHHLTRFLRDAPARPEAGSDFVAQFARERRQQDGQSHRH